MEDKRRSRRINFKEPVQFLAPGQSEPEGCVSCDLSETGIRLNSSLFIPLRQKLAMTIQADGENEINVDGRVIWIQRVPHSEYYQMGLEFETQAEDASLKALQDYIQSQQRDYQGEA